MLVTIATGCTRPPKLYLFIYILPVWFGIWPARGTGWGADPWYAAMAVGEMMDWLWLAAAKSQMYNVFFHSPWIEPFALSKKIIANFSSIATSVLILRELYEVECLCLSRLTPLRGVQSGRLGAGSSPSPWLLEGKYISFVSYKAVFNCMILALRFVSL